MNKKIITTAVILVVILVGLSVYLNYKNSNRAEMKAPIAGSKPEIVLKADGLGAVAFGATPSETIAILTSAFGAPTKDTGWIDSFSPYGICPGEKIRGVEWNNLHVLFGDTLFGKQAFFGFEYVNRTGINEPVLKTEKLITLGATKTQIQTAYPNATFGDWLPGQTGTTFVHGAEGSGEYLGGTLEEDKLFWISGGIFCGE